MSEGQSERRCMISKGSSKGSSSSSTSYFLWLLTLALIQVLLWTPTTASQEIVVKTSPLIRHDRHRTSVGAMSQDHRSTIVQHSIGTNDAVNIGQQESQQLKQQQPSSSEEGEAEVGHRELSATDYLDFDVNVGESLDHLFSTPMNEWTIGQWLFAVVLLCLILWCCGCLACQGGGGRRYYRHSYYNNYRNNRGGGGGGGCCDCLRNLLLCFCCYELCCDDGQNLPFLSGGEYA